VATIPTIRVSRGPGPGYLRRAAEANADSPTRRSLIPGGSTVPLPRILRAVPPVVASADVGRVHIGSAQGGGYARRRGRPCRTGQCDVAEYWAFGRCCRHNTLRVTDHPRGPAAGATGSELVLWINNRCYSVLVSADPLRRGAITCVASLGKTPARGDLFDHMHEGQPPKSHDTDAPGISYGLSIGASH
jgi:hypothetical protein